MIESRTPLGLRNSTFEGRHRLSKRQLIWECCRCLADIKPRRGFL